MIRRDACKGCREDHYNQPGNSTEGRCWSAKTGEMVKRFRLGWWTQPDAKGAYTEVTVPDCYNQRGQYAYHARLPDFVKAEDVVRSSRARGGR